MTLENLLRIGRLKEHPTEAVEIQRLLSAAVRNLTDSRTTAISPATRFDAAYRGIMQAALAAMMAHGYRPDTNQPGHHQTIIQALPKTIGLSQEKMAALDTLRRMRNTVDYCGDDVDEQVAVTCSESAQRLIKSVSDWIAMHRPEFETSPAQDQP
jgi:hypothetical protein